MATLFDPNNRKRNVRIASKLRQRAGDGIPLSDDEKEWLRLYEAHKGRPGRKRVSPIRPVSAPPAPPAPTVPVPEAGPVPQDAPTPDNMHASSEETPPADAPPLNLGGPADVPPIEQKDPKKKDKWWDDGDVQEYTSQELAELYGAALMHFNDKLPEKYPRIPAKVIQRLVIPAAKFLLEKNLPSMDDIDPEKAAHVVVAAPAVYVGGSHLVEWWRKRNAENEGKQQGDIPLKVVQ